MNGEVHDLLEQTKRNLESVRAKLAQLSAKLIELADGRKRLDQRIGALAEMVRRPRTN